LVQAKAEQEVVAEGNLELGREAVSGRGAEEHVLWWVLALEMVIDGEPRVDVDKRGEFNHCHFWRLEDASVDLDFA
jgi:hypothetical protein